ncbi:MAG TPA: hypothetical protein ENO23_01770, partial [Alphaproteobacteria bacterium]|nr:hypothetical protein [Alphaproteobacteria bacterium]
MSAPRQTDPRAASFHDGTRRRPMDTRVIPTPDRTPTPFSRRIVPALLALWLPVLATCGGEGSPTQADAEATGALKASTATTGDDVDTDGYTVTVGEESLAIGANDTLLVVDLAAGDHVVEISNLSSNCGVLGAGNLRNVSVTAGDTVSTHFSVGCSGRSALEVTTTTVAGGLDDDGFRLAVDGGPVRTIGTDDTETFLALASGDHTVELSGLATGCSVSGSNPRSVTLESDQIATTGFEVRCGLRNRILFRSDRNGGDDLWMMGADGSDPRLFFGRDGRDLSPAVSADGSRVVFVSEDSPGADHFDIWVVEADGSNATKLGPGGPGSHFDPDFSPD